MSTKGVWALEVRAIKEYIAAEVIGVDLTDAIEAEMFAEFRMALYRHAVLVFRDQEITDKDQGRFSEGFGRLELTIPSDPIGDGGPVGVVSNLDSQGEIIPPSDARSLYMQANRLWHSDGSFRRVPLKGSLLAAKCVPPSGGATEFASLVAPYAALPANRKKEIELLRAVHSLAYSREQVAPNLISSEFLRDTPPAEHPLVREVSETGEKALLVGSYAGNVVGWPTAKGRILLEELLAWCTQPHFVYRHEWQVHDIVVYDNRLCLHRGTAWDENKYKRVLHRTTLAWDEASV